MVSSPFKKLRPRVDEKLASCTEKHNTGDDDDDAMARNNSVLNDTSSVGSTSSHQRDSATGGRRGWMNNRNKQHRLYKQKFGQKVEVAPGKFLEGEELEDFCKKRGLCPLCARTRVRKRVFKFFKKNQWEPITQLSKDRTFYVVYKGYCVVPDCFTLEQAKRLSGELKGDGKRPSGILKSSVVSSSNRNSNINMSPQPRAIPKERHSGSVMEETTISNESDSQRGATHRRATSAFPPLEDKQQLMQQPASLPLQLLPLIDKTIQGLQADTLRYFIQILDLSNVQILRPIDIFGLLTALKTNITLLVLNLECCKLDDSHMEPLGRGLLDAKELPLQKLYLRSNAIHSDGVDALCPFLESTTSLKRVDLSRNRIGTSGGVAVFNAFRRNASCKIEAINMSHNELSDLEQDSFGIRGFLAKNRTLVNLNLEGNFIHDEGAQALFEGLEDAGENGTLQRLYLGWNSIGDDGAIALGTCLAANHSLQFIDLENNHIRDAGGRALLSALDHHSTLREISGLWRNKIDRRFIIVSIRRLLLSRDGGYSRCGHGSFHSNGTRIEAREEQAPASANRIAGTTAEAGEDSHYFPADDDVSDLSDDPLDHDSDSDDDLLDIVVSERQVDDELDLECENDLNPLLLTSMDPNPLTNMGHLKLDSTNDTSTLDTLPMAETLMETNQEVSYHYDRISFFQSSPLVFFEKDLGIHRSISLYDSKYERLMVEVAVDESVLDGTQIEVTADVATMDRFTSFFAEKNSHVMHVSCYGLSGGLSLENGFGSIQTIPLDGLRRLIAAVGSSLDFVFVSSCSAKIIGEAFVDAGIPHVVCCEKEDAFRDPVAVEFIQCFYREAAKSRNLCDAFEDAVEMITSSQITRHMREVKQRFHLLPDKPNSTGYHKKRIFFNQLIPSQKNKDCFERFLHIPAVPNHFTGREIDMYEILESIRVDDIVKITGTPGYGKESIIAAVAEYAMERRKMFVVDNVFWIPTPEGVKPEPDSLYDDLCQCCNLIRTAKEDIWDTNDALLECKERLRIELEDIKMILVVDDRSFSSKGCQDALEKFINFIVKNSSSKVVLITSRGNQVSPSLFLTTYNSTVGSSRMIEERTITISTLDFRSTAILFGNLTRFISSLAHTASEFADLLEPPFISRMANPLVVSSQRRADLFARMGNGLPSAVIAAAERINQKDFHQLIKIARKPEFYVESLSELEIELRRRRLQKEKAILDKNYVRATDLDTIIDELEGMRPEFPTLKDLKEKEQSLKAALYDAVDNHRYDTVNDLKRKLLTLKKKIMKESRLLSGQADNRNSKLNQFQAQIETSIEGDDDSLKLGHLDRRVAFSVNCDNRNCIFSFYYGDIYDFSHPSKANGIVCWTNEACDLSSTIEGKELLIRGGAAMQKDLSSLPTIHRTLYGDARCDTGSAILLGPTPEYQQRLPASAIILTVGPFCCSGVSSPFESLIESDDEDILHYTKVMLRSCYRCCMELARQCELKVLGVSLLTTHKTRVAYQNTITIGLQTLIAEAKYSHLTDIHIISKTPKEASLMVSCMLEMGYKMTDDA